MTTINGKAETVIKNANIITIDTGRPKAQALAMTHGSCTAVGSNEGIDGLSGAGARLRDWGGQAAMFKLQDQWFWDRTTDDVVGNFANSGGRNPSSTLFGSFPSDNDDQVTITAQLQLLF